MDIDGSGCKGMIYNRCPFSVLPWEFLTITMGQLKSQGLLCSVLQMGWQVTTMSGSVCMHSGNSHCSLPSIVHLHILVCSGPMLLRLPTFYIVAKSRVRQIRLPNCLKQSIFGSGNHNLQKSCLTRQVQIIYKLTLILSHMLQTSKVILISCKPSTYFNFVT